MKTLLRLLFLLAACQMMFGQAANIPVCNTLNPAPGTCTDYFGYGNYANSPVPAGPVSGLTLVNGGTGYTNPSVQITDLARE